MRLPLVALAALAVIGGLVGLPEHWLWGDAFGAFLAPVLARGHDAHHAGAAHAHAPEALLMLASVAAAVAGIGAAYFLYIERPAERARLRARFPGVERVLSHAYYVDELYEALIVRPVAALAGFAARVLDPQVIDACVNGLARLAAALGGGWRRLQTGNVQHYALSLLLGAAAIVLYYAVP
jgi:NADH-quinone oxidoreductase subunit L